MIRYPLIEAKLQGTAWCATPKIMRAMFTAIRNPRPDAKSLADAVGGNSDERPQARKVFGARGAISVVSLSEPAPEGAVAVIPVHGIVAKYLSGMEASCGGFDLQAFERQLEQAAADASVTDIVLHINSPGGTITGVSEASQLISQVNATKPVFAFTDSEMCSAAYWLGVSGSGVFCSDLASIGSIGVYLAWIDESQAMEDAGLKLMLFKDGTLKASTLPGQLTDEAGQLLQAEVESIGATFRQAVRDGRKASSDATVSDETMQGQVFLGRDAVKVGLADGLYRSLNDLILNILSN